MLAHDELGTCEARLVPPEQFVLSMLIFDKSQLVHTEL